jgi:F-type H+-transporting ATPase subunit a
VSETVLHLLPYIVIFNFGLAALALVALAFVMTRKITPEAPDALQNAAEYVLEWFVGRAREIRPDGVSVIAPFLASLFLFILFCNLLSVISFPVINIPPTSYYSGTLTLALIAILGITIINTRFNGLAGAAKHLFWPNPLQIVSEVSHTLSLSLRLFGNIGGEFMVALLVAKAAPYGIPLIIHALGLIPAFIQPLVFTLLTTNFLAEAVHREERRPRRKEREEGAQTGPASSEVARTEKRIP